MAALEAKVTVQGRQIHALRRELRALDERVDTVCSPFWKRVWWCVQGYRWYRVGRWYRKTEDLR